MWKYTSVRDFETKYNRYSCQYYVVKPYRTKHIRIRLLRYVKCHMWNEHNKIKKC